MEDQNISRRQFLKQTGAGAVGVGMLPQVLPQGLLASVDLSNAPAVDKKQLVAALADAIMPTADGYPGYRRLEQFGITDEVLKGLGGINQQECNLFNAAAQEFLGKPFVELDEAARSRFLEMVVASFSPAPFAVDPAQTARAAEALSSKLDATAIQTLQKVFRTTRGRVFIVFYQNFPENQIKRDQNKLPALPQGDLHQIINPNTKQVVTGWDVANFPGPLSWEEEEARRAMYKKIHWHEE